MKSLKRLYYNIKSEDKAGLYITVLIHIIVIIFLLLIQIQKEIQANSSFIIDFSQQNKLELEKEKNKLIEEKKALEKEIEKKINKALASSSHSSIKNIAVDLASLAKEINNEDASKLYQDAEDLKKRLKDGQKEEISDNEVKIYKSKKKEKSKEYSGPSVVSYQLDNRKARYLHIPAYKCFGAGLVTVLITVNSSGRVISTSIREEDSSKDKCLRNTAIDAAKRSIFTADKDKKKQGGFIIYKFIEQ